MNSLIQKRMIFWTFGLVALFGAVAMFFLLQPPRPFAKKFVRNGRMPAAIVEEADPSVVQEPVAQVRDHRVGCDPESAASFEHSVQQVRLRGEPCKSGKASIVSAEITNTTNGFIATVFYSDQQSFTTDYISLNQGENLITLSLKYSDGSIDSRSLRFDRQ